MKGAGYTAEKLNGRNFRKSFFHKVYRMDSDKRNPVIREPDGLNLMQSVQITCSKIKAAIMRLNKTNQ